MACVGCLFAADAAGMVGSFRSWVRCLPESSPVDHRGSTVSPLEIAPLHCLVALGTEVRQRIKRGRTAGVLLGKPDLVTAESAAAAIPKNGSVVSVKDQLGTPGVRIAILKERDDLLHQVGVKA